MEATSFKTNPMVYYFYHVLPGTIIRDVIFRELLELKDIARLEVAAAVRSLWESQVRISCSTPMLHAHIVDRLLRVRL
jgi:hypothetical protein